MSEDKDEKVKKECEFLRGLAPKSIARSGSDNGSSSPKTEAGHCVIDLVCVCGYEGTVTYGQMDFRLLGKDRKGFLYFECPECERHLQYDPISGKIKARKGILGSLFGRFS